MFYGENYGLKKEFIEKFFKNENDSNIINYEESEILNDENIFYDHLLTKSFFDNKKTLIVSRVTDKIFNVIEDVLTKNLFDVTVILSSGVLEKKSKLRNLIEKHDKAACIAFYGDDERSLSKLANEFFIKNKISISREIVNLLIERSRNDRENLKNEMEKIKLSLNGKKSVSFDNVRKITNTAENYSISEIVDNCLAKRTKKLKTIMNENQFSQEDAIILTKTFLSKAKRLLKINEIVDEIKDIDKAITYMKPPIFWKDKEVVRRQLELWNKEKITEFIYELNEIEFLLKKKLSKFFNNFI